MSGCGNGATVEPLRHRQTKGAANRYARPTATAPHSYSTDEKGGVLAGHGRVLAARRLGLEEVPTITLDHLTEAERRAFMFADNRLGELASWDDERLGLELEELKSLDLDFSIEATGFELNEIDQRIG